MQFFVEHLFDLLPRPPVFGSLRHLKSLDDLLGRLTTEAPETLPAVVAETVWCFFLGNADVLLCFELICFAAKVDFHAWNRILDVAEGFANRGRVACCALMILVAEHYLAFGDPKTALQLSTRSLGMVRRSLKLGYSNCVSSIITLLCCCCQLSSDAISESSANVLAAHCYRIHGAILMNEDEQAAISFLRKVF